MMRQTEIWGLAESWKVQDIDRMNLMQQQILPARIQFCCK